MSGVEPALPLLYAESAALVGVPLLRAPLEGQDIVADYASLRLRLRRHPLALLREELNRQGVITHQELWNQRSGRRVAAAGLVITRQRPGSARGTCCM